MDLGQLLKSEMTTAGKKKEKIGDIPASVVLVTRDDIETHGYQTLPEILKSIPGLYLTDDYFSKNIGVRGFWSITPNRNLIILVNGISYKEDLSSSYLLENITVPVEAIDKIEVVRGPMSVVYGNGALFGVINIITNQIENNADNNIVALSAGSEKTGKVFARAAGEGKDYRYSINGSFHSTDGFNYPLERIGGPEMAEFSTEGRLERSEKYFNFSGTYKGIFIDACLSENDKESLTLLPSVADGTKTLFKDMRFQVGYQKDISDTLSIKAQFGYFHNQLSFDFDMLIDNIYALQENGASGFYAGLTTFFNPSDDLDLTVGVNYHHVNEAYNSYTIPFFALNLVHHNLADGDAIVTQSLFSQLTYNLTDKIKIVAGAMLEQTPKYTLEERIGDYQTLVSSSTEATFSQTGVEFIPRLALLYSVNENNVFKFLYGKAITRPSFFQNMDLVINAGFKQLEPETIQTFEFNYVGYLSSSLTVSASIFRNSLDKLIYRSLIPGAGDFSTYHANVGEMATTGVEVTIQGNPLARLRIELSGTYQDTEDKRAGFENIEVAYSPKFLGYVKASYFLNKDISLAVSGNYVDEMEPYFDDTLATPGRLGNKIDGYFLLGANLRIRNVLGTGAFVNLRVSNLLDEEIRYPTTTNNSAFAGLGTIGRSRSFLLTIGWKF
jgi:outer membrane receptor protein involved in Fe transport